ncbi:MAG TPA: methionine--tRNA ligase [Vicinamibacterales bacterium]|jgi:methionyl-tRNA synthetase
MSRFFLTTAIDYVNSRPHLGTAYEKISADVIARYKRLCGVRTHFLMGNDEHSQNVYRRAIERGLDPLAYCDQMEREFRDTWARLEISFDDFIRTTEPRHRVGVSAMVQKIAETGDLYDGFYEGPYCVSCEAFKPEKDLVDGLCPVHGVKPEWIREKNHFFRLSRYREALLAHYDEHPEFLQPDVRRNEILRLLEGGLEDISISRAGQLWGIPVPFDSTSVVYVWFDALINYISAIGYGRDGDGFEQWWPADLHIVGKDITRFHCVIWPAMLMSAGLPLPRQVFGHGFVQYKGQRMSKTLGTVLDPLDAAARFGPDPLRLYLVKEIPYGQDGDFSWERFEERYNVDLANNLGNLVNRLAVMTDKYRGGRLPAAPGAPGRLADVAASAVQRYRAAMERYALHEAAFAAFALVDAANEYIAETEPWTLARQAKEDRLTQVLSDVVEAVRISAILLMPVMPGSCAEILRRMGETRGPETLRLDLDAAWGGLCERVVARADPLWPRIDSPVPAVQVTNQREQENVMSQEPTGKAPEQASPPAEPANPPVAVTPPSVPAGPGATTSMPAAAEKIPIEDFAKVDLRVAKILAAEKVKGSRKLIKMQIDLGTEQRTIVAGIAEAYEADALVGRSIVVVANLKPAKLMGIESNGMVLAASPEGGLPALLGFENPPPPGSRIK